MTLVYGHDQHHGSSYHNGGYHSRYTTSVPTSSTTVVLPSSFAQAEALPAWGIVLGVIGIAAFGAIITWAVVRK